MEADHRGHDWGHGTNLTSVIKALNYYSDELYHIYDAMEDNTVLMIFGDHGMSVVGSHFGNSFEERNTALFTTIKSKTRKINRPFLDILKKY